MSKPPRPGCFIAFEGVEGAGKSTQVGLLASALRRLGRRVQTTFEPGDTAFGREIRHLVMRTDGATPSSTTELLLYLADRAQHLDEMIRPALSTGAVVVCDRFSGSTIAYQGYGRELDVELVSRLDAAVRAGIEPDLTILLDCAVEDGLRRARGDDRLQRENVAFHHRVQRGFHTLARDNPAWVTIRTDRPVAEVARDVLGAVNAAAVLSPCPSPAS